MLIPKDKPAGIAVAEWLVAIERLKQTEITEVDEQGDVAEGLVAIERLKQHCGAPWARVRVALQRGWSRLSD